ncbi:RNA polymerase I-specific transcription initiation factor RRN3 [Orussus abietinus]|uniref:RNA polymerase I-specific transcription initiation factor RRN3 n=1 Tax=Orussus abietinus TaxID=222816 RepID=UPI000625B377|nr:RNA polymerase I-specific transcription initiation factor RRN3 [Orussus abietinus]
MSVVSSRVSSVSSLLKGPGMRSKLIGQSNRVNFKLPKNLKNILSNFENGCDRKIYEDLIRILRDSNIKDNELIELLTDMHQCIPQLGPVHGCLVGTLLNIEWIGRGEGAVLAYKGFLEDLVCAHVYHTKFVVDRLVNLFMPDDEATEWEDGNPREEDLRKLNHVHDALNKLLKIIPMSGGLLLQAVTSAYPYMKRGTHIHQRFLHALLQISEYAPHLRSDILSLIINRLIILDVNAPTSEIEDYEEEEMQEEDTGGGGVFNMEDIGSNDKAKPLKALRHPVAHTLDVCMEQVLSYIYGSCHVQGTLELESLKGLYHEILQIFEKIILPTHASHHVQFIMFYICSFKVVVAEAFLNWLWRKVSNPNVAPVIRQSAVSYIASLLARAAFMPLELLTAMLQEMSQWVHSYVSSQDSLECVNSDVRVHSVFYSVCQAMFYLIAFRHKDLVDTKKNLLILQSLNLTKIVTCRLNPLRVCQPAVIQNFAAVTRTYQLAYCYTVIERNSRSNLPVLQNSNRLSTWLDTFFPFDPYALRLSSHRIISVYIHYQGSVNVESATAGLKDETDEDDFMDESFPQSMDSYGHKDKFSYSTSPGFIHT